jgi:hypothetical protein
MRQDWVYDLPHHFVIKITATETSGFYLCAMGSVPAGKAVLPFKQND